ncbi:MAG: hypothetical protein K0M63_04560 [Weeksellaceae bacterium]|nr:hypothetical protein [Weeksellaceae bacterium]
MKITKNTLIVVLYFVMFAVHFVLWQLFVKDFVPTFIRYYLFLSVIFMMVLTVLSILKRIYPNYLGFAFMGLLLVKLSLMFIVMNRLNLAVVPQFKLHFIPPYLISLVLETLYAINLVNSVTVDNSKDEKNQ